MLRRLPMRFAGGQRHYPSKWEDALRLVDVTRRRGGHHDATKQGAVVSKTSLMREALGGALMEVTSAPVVSDSSSARSKAIAKNSISKSEALKLADQLLRELLSLDDLEEEAGISSERVTKSEVGHASPLPRRNASLERELTVALTLSQSLGAVRRWQGVLGLSPARPCELNLRSEQERNLLPVSANAVLSLAGKITRRRDQNAHQLTPMRIPSEGDAMSEAKTADSILQVQLDILFETLCCLRVDADDSLGATEYWGLLELTKLAASSNKAAHAFKNTQMEGIAKRLFHQMVPLTVHGRFSVPDRIASLLRESRKSKRLEMKRRDLSERARSLFIMFCEHHHGGRALEPSSTPAAVLAGILPPKTLFALIDVLEDLTARSIMATLNRELRCSLGIATSLDANAMSAKEACEHLVRLSNKLERGRDRGRWCEGRAEGSYVACGYISPHESAFTVKIAEEDFIAKGNLGMGIALLCSIGLYDLAAQHVETYVSSVLHCSQLDGLDGAMASLIPAGLVGYMRQKALTKGISEANTSLSWAAALSQCCDLIADRAFFDCLSSPSPGRLSLTDEERIGAELAAAEVIVDVVLSEAWSQNKSLASSEPLIAAAHQAMDRLLKFIASKAPVASFCALSAIDEAYVTANLRKRSKGATEKAPAQRFVRLPCANGTIPRAYRGRPLSKQHIATGQAMMPLVRQKAFGLLAATWCEFPHAMSTTLSSSPPPTAVRLLVCPYPFREPGATMLVMSHSVSTSPDTSEHLVKSLPEGWRRALPIPLCGGAGHWSRLVHSLPTLPLLSVDAVGPDQSPSLVADSLVALLSVRQGMACCLKRRWLNECLLAMRPPVTRGGPAVPNRFWLAVFQRETLLHAAINSFALEAEMIDSESGREDDAVFYSVLTRRLDAFAALLKAWEVACDGRKRLDDVASATAADDDAPALTCSNCFRGDLGGLSDASSTLSNPTTQSMRLAFACCPHCEEFISNVVQERQSNAVT